MLVGHLVGHVSQGVLQSRTVEVADSGEPVGLGGEVRAGAVGVHEHQRTTVAHLVGDGGLHRAGRRQFEEIAEGGQQRVGVDAGVEPVDRVHAQLLLDELADVGHGQFGGALGAGVGGALLVAEGTADGVAMVAVGDHHVGPTHGRRDGGHARRIVDAFDGVHHTFGLDHAHHLAGLGEQVGETTSQ